MNRRLFAVLALAALTGSVPAYADDAQSGVRVGAEYAGAISAVAPHLGVAMTGVCGWAAVLMPNNRFQVNLTGTASSVGTVPVLTYVKCTIANGVGESLTVQRADAGPVAVAPPTGVTWRALPSTVCVEGFALYGPTPVTQLNLTQMCDTKLL